MKADFCCVHALDAARHLAWKERDLNCGCDHNEYCGKCYPVEMRTGGYYDQQRVLLTTDQPIATVTEGLK